MRNQIIRNTSAGRGSRRGLAVGVMACLALGGLGIGWVGDGVKPFPDEWFFDGAQRAAPLKALEGKAATELSIESWIGTSVKISESKGKVVVVDFWATWCGPCMASIPHNVELVKKYADQGLVFVGVHDSNSGWDKADAVVKDKGINYPVGVDKSGGQSVKDYALQFWPTYVVVDRNGTIRAAGLTPDRVEDVVKALLAEKGAEVRTAGGTSEFGNDHYVGGAGRPKLLKEMEGKAAPRPKGESWLGKDPGDTVWTNNVVVLTFVSPSLSVSMAELDKMVPVEKELGAQGAVFIGVCDGRGGDEGWAKMTERVKAKSLAMPVMRDTVEKKPGEGGKPVSASVTATAFGVELYPATIIIDRTGKVRAAGVRADKVKAVVEKLLGESAGAKKEDEKADKPAK